MNTERPDNDDDAREAGGAGAADPARDIGGVSDGERGSADTRDETEAGSDETEAGAVDAEDAAEAPGSADAQDAAEAAESGEDAEAGQGSETPDAESREADTPEVAETEQAAETGQAPETPEAPEAADAREEDDTAKAASAPEPEAGTESTGADEAGPAPDRAAGAAAGEVPDSDLPRDEEDLVHSGGGRPRTPAIIASVAAAVLLIGGGGAWLATNVAGGSGGGQTSGAPGGDDTPPPLALDGYSESTASTAGGQNGIAPGEPNPYGATYRLGGPLPDGPGEAPVYRARGEVTKEDVARLAKALGVEGAPVAQGEAWKVGAGQDGSGPSLQVNKQAPGAWTFNRYAPGTDNCKGTDTCTAPQSGGTPVSEAAAEKAAAPVLKAVGQDDAKRDASQTMGAQRVVNAAPEVGGLPTHGWTTGVTVGSDGEVVGGSGQLKAPAKGDTYPVVSAKKALELMETRPKNDHRMGIGGCASAVPQKDRLEQPCGSSSSGAPEQDTVTVRNAVFGLASHFVDGRQALVPSWLFEVTAPGAKDPFTVTYPAVDPKYLTSSTPSEPSDKPTAAPGPRDVEVDGYRAEGAELTVTFTGGVCADYDVKASEKGGEVTVEVTSTAWPDKVCIMIAKQFQETVRLDEPLGDRAVVGSDGKAVPLAKEGARLPAPPTRER
ncbi:hypothetical protein GCM10010313_67180 [Streptomyces violarus]|uniref:Large membrane protein n=1 Tax=Streptomyces violarus TaxID=67380 RepID=A0A7W5F458_9ACTN|nr:MULTISPECIES: hypothetical protein [Streptomyces]MBB3079219.1 hypothetical protein [Streptomyces violarus]WRU01768.1 hypothetical protein VJ737_30655 [Streptomyces sp. CGMCC 4.1772]GHD27267.1 hypothetical protein GCM10010313_67180 [Streptomyces violarus]